MFVMNTIDTKGLLLRIWIPTTALSISYLILGHFCKIPHILLFCILGTVILVPIELGFILAAGAGLTSTNKDMADSLFFWGVGRICRYGKGVAAIAWKGAEERKRASIDRATISLEKKIVRRYGKEKPGIKTRVFFFVMHLMQRKGFNERDAGYWREKGWTGSKRPWKQ